ncbi:hypothetical protein GCM10007989_02000 [Devosia pacifica]|uniref:Uncharacterized protein n=1 Tax=Devosia pacifica TaxID=1335967 RepID=A0A918RSM5_9HYPH|nr:hypothetical protein GCM10007989_02000 [Devosia pacifica]
MWEAYGHTISKAAAQRAYDELAPDEALHLTIIEAARAWRAEYDRQGREPRFRKRLHTWIADRCWEQELPKPYRQGKQTQPKKPRVHPGEVLRDFTIEDVEGHRLTIRPNDREEGEPETFSRVFAPEDVAGITSAAGRLEGARVWLVIDADERHIWHPHEEALEQSKIL